MPDLSMIIVVPKALANEHQIGAAIETVKLAYKMQETTVDIHYQVRMIDGPDGDVYYDGNFNAVFGHVAEDVNRLRRVAGIIAGQNPRRTYVLFVCREIMDRVPQSTQLVPRQSNGFTLTGESVSVIAMQQPKATIGDADARTWAHEIGHGLGLSHTDGADIANLMHPARHDDHGQATGFELTTSQKWTMVRHCEGLANTGVPTGM